MKSGDFPKSRVFQFDDDVEISRVEVRMEREHLTKEVGYRNVVYLEKAGAVASNSLFRYRVFQFPVDTVLVVKEQPC